MTDDVIERWADLLVDYCLRVREDETILIGSDWEGQSLVAACARAVIRRGAYPLPRLELPGLTEYFLMNASESQLSHVPKAAVLEAEAVDGRIVISAQSDTRGMSQVDPKRQAIRDRARQVIRGAAARSRWVVTQFPTAAYAHDASMPLADYESYVISSMFLDRSDPVAEWKALGQRQAGLVTFMSQVKTIHIEGEGTDLKLSVDGRTWINSDGRRNMPSGEIFTGPHELSPQGKLRCGFPVCRDGRQVAGIELEFRDGLVVNARAETGEDYLLSMLQLDPGARRLGELGIGLNPGIDRFTGSILYDEKIGGTVHVALGQSYPETGGINESALHWDLILDLRHQGRITADNRVVMKDGCWLVH